jgi:hypothetical protein
VDVKADRVDLGLSGGTVISKLERTTHICLIALSIIAAGLLLERRFTPASGGTAPVNGTGLLGKHLDAPGLDWKRAKLNAVLLLSTKCHFCKDSMPFYGRLADEKRRRQDKCALVVLSREPSESVKSFLSSQRVFVDGVYQFSPDDPQLRATPELLLVDSNGAIQRSYIGRLSRAQEEEVLDRVRRGAP